jgi:hypothetical protein
LRRRFRSAPVSRGFPLCYDCADESASFPKVRRGPAKDYPSRQQIRSCSAGGAAFGRHCELMLLNTHRRDKRFTQYILPGGRSRQAIWLGHNVNHERDPHGDTDRFLHRRSPAFVIGHGTTSAHFVRETPGRGAALSIPNRTSRAPFRHPCHPPQLRTIVLLPNPPACTASVTQCLPKLRDLSLASKASRYANSQSHNSFRQIGLRSPRTLRSVSRNCATRPLPGRGSAVQIRSLTIASAKSACVHRERYAVSAETTPRCITSSRGSLLSPESQTWQATLQARTARPSLSSSVPLNINIHSQSCDVGRGCVA